MSHVMVIAEHTAREAYRRRLVWLGLGLGAAFLAVYGIGLHYISIDISRYASGSALYADGGFGMVTMSAYYVVSFLGSVLAVLVGAGGLSAEIASHAMQSLAARPVRRFAIVLGRWLGLAALLTSFVVVLAAGVAGVTWLVTGYTPLRLAAGIALLVLQSLIMLSIAMAASARLSTMACGVLGFMLYGLAFVGGWIEQFAWVARNQAAMDVGVISSLLVPSEAMWKLAAHLMQPPVLVAIGPFSVGNTPSTAMLVYAILYVLACVALAVRLFATRDL